MTVQLYRNNIRSHLSNFINPHQSKKEIEPFFFYHPLEPTIEFVTEENPFGSIINGTEEEQKKLSDRIRMITQEFEFETVFIHPITYELGCIHWQAKKVYDFSVRHGSIPLRFTYTYSYCDNIGASVFKKITTYLKGIVILISLISLIFNISQFGFYMYIFGKKFKNGSIKLKGIWKYIQWWAVVSSFANILNIIGCSILIINFDTETVYKICNLNFK